MSDPENRSAQYSSKCHCGLPNFRRKTTLSCNNFHFLLDTFNSILWVNIGVLDPRIVDYIHESLRLHISQRCQKPLSLVYSNQILLQDVRIDNSVWTTQVIDNRRNIGYSIPVQLW